MMTLAELTAIGLESIASITKSLSDAHAGKITPDEALAQIATRHTARAAEQAASDQALADRFKTP